MNTANTSPSPTAGFVEVVVHDGKYLCSKNSNADVYVKLKLGDGFFNWNKTNTAKLLNPTWNFVSTMKVRPKQNKVLHFRVNEGSFFAPEKTIGECHLNLEDVTPNETHTLCMPIFPLQENNKKGTNVKSGELCFSVAYHPDGNQPLPNKDTKTTLPLHLLDHFTSDKSANPYKSPTLSKAKTPEQLKAGLLYEHAMEELGKFIAHAHNGSDAEISSSVKIQYLDLFGFSERLHNKALEEISKFTQKGAQPDIDIQAILKSASNLLFESLKIHREGKAFAMLAFIFFQCDNLELSAKYLGYATQMLPTFPVIGLVRGLLVSHGCDRTNLGSEKGGDDRLSVVVCQAKVKNEDITKNLKGESEGLFCRVVMGYSETVKDTALVLPDATTGSAHWEAFFECYLTKAVERYLYGQQHLVVQIFTQKESVVTLLGATEPIDLFALERNAVHDQWVTTTNGEAEIRVIFNYQLGFMDEDQVLPLLYSALRSHDHVMVTALLKLNPKLNKPFRDTNSHATPSEIDPKFSTLLTKAARFGKVRMMKELIDFGAKINATDEEGFTPIMRAVQFDGVHDNVRAIRYLEGLGADLMVKNKRGFDIFSYCQTVDMRIYFKERTQMQMYNLAVVICPQCTYIQFPVCTESGGKTFQGKNCKCGISACPNCKFEVGEEHKKDWVISKREVEYAIHAYTASLPDVLDHYLFQCPNCTSFGFPGTCTPDGSLLTSATDDAVVATMDNSFEKVEIPLKDAVPMWTLLYHAAGCSMFTAKYQLVRSKLPRSAVMELQELSEKSYSCWDYNASEIPDGATPMEVDTKKELSYTLDQLPSEILQNVIGYLACEDIAVFEQVSTKMKETCNHNFWRFVTKRDYKITTRRDIDWSWKYTYLFYTKTCNWIKELLCEENFAPKLIISIIENGQVEARVTLNGKKYLFNLDGTPFTFEEEFTIIMVFDAPGQIASVNLIAESQSVPNALKLCGVVTIAPPNTLDKLRNEMNEKSDSKVTMFLKMQDNAIKRWLTPYLGLNVPGFYAFLMLKDNVAGSVILDIFYFELQNVKFQPPLPVSPIL